MRYNPYNTLIDYLSDKLVMETLVSLMIMEAAKGDPVTSGAVAEMLDDKMDAARKELRAGLSEKLVEELEAMGLED